MRKYKINRENNIKLPPIEVIKKHKDFNKIRMQYDDITKRPKEPLYRNKKLFLFIIILGLLAWLIAESIAEEEKDQNSNKTEIVE